MKTPKLEQLQVARGFFTPKGPKTSGYCKLYKWNKNTVKLYKWNQKNTREMVKQQHLSNIFLKHPRHKKKKIMEKSNQQVLHLLVKHHEVAKGRIIMLQELNPKRKYCCKEALALHDGTSSWSQWDPGIMVLDSHFWFHEFYLLNLQISSDWRQHWKYPTLPEGKFDQSGCFPVIPNRSNHQKVWLCENNLHQPDMIY